MALSFGNGGMDDEKTKDKLIKNGGAAKLLGVCPAPLRAWDQQGLLKPIRTLGGHRRYWENEVRQLLDRSAIA